MLTGISANILIYPVKNTMLHLMIYFSLLLAVTLNILNLITTETLSVGDKHGYSGSKSFIKKTHAFLCISMQD